MTSIGVEQPTASLRLCSCPSCGRHSWYSGGREVERAEVLAALRAERPAAPARRTPPVDADERARRQDLQRMLGGFTVHGSTS